MPETTRRRIPYDHLADQYDAMFTRPRDQAENREVARRIRKLGASGTVLDLGCGTGFFLELIAKDPSEYVGIDISAAMLAKARLKYPEHAFDIGDMSQLSYEADSFDFVVALWSFSYTTNPERAANEVRRVLKPGGKFFAIVYADWGPVSPLPYEDWPSYHPVTRSMFSAADIYSLFRCLNDRRVTGLSAKAVPDAISARFMPLETRLIGRLFPDACRYLMFSGSKCA